MSAKKNKMNPLLLPVILLSLLVVILTVLLIRSYQDQPKEGQQETNQQNEISQTVEQPEKIPETEPDEPVLDDMIVETPYCNLYLPGQWKDNITVEIAKEDIGCIIEFCGSIDNSMSWLYTLYLGDTSDNAFPVGVLETDEGNLDINMEMAELIKTDGMSDEDFEKFCAMQESLNHVIEKLKLEDTFVSE